MKLLSLLIFFFSVATPSCKENMGNQTDAPTPAKPVSQFLRREAKLIVDGNGQPALLKGVAFGNEVWSDKPVPNTHHNEEDFKRVSAMNMNAIRFYLNYKTLEDDASPYQYKQSGWDWLDQNIAWAKKYNIYLILNVHAPQGGYQSQGNGDNLWTIPENQNRLAAMWKAIAKRYSNEPQIAGFGLVNEPVPTTSKAQWEQLAQKLIGEIRQADTNHIIFAERIIYLKTLVPEDAELNFPSLQDDNLVYEFHLYDPFEYTHQLFEWSNLGDGGKYPDETKISYSNAAWYTATFDNPNLPPGNTDWKYVEGVKYKVTDEKIKLGVPALVGAAVGGKVYFDDIVIREFDSAGNFVKEVVKMSLDDLTGWFYWTADGTGKKVLTTTGHSNGKSLAIEGATGDCNLSNSGQAFLAKQNHYYQICGWMKGENAAATSACKLRIDFNTTTSPIYSRNKQYLESVIKRFTDWAGAKNVPLYIGEFGAGVPCFENNKGGLNWVSDMLDIIKANNLSFTYHTYHEDNFGLYYGYGTLPDPAKSNQPLIGLFTEKLKK